MPCDTPPPPIPVDDEQNNAMDEDDFIEIDESMYEIIDPDDPDSDPEGDIVVTQDDSVATYLGHSGPVFMCNFDKSGRYIVSGSQDDMAYVWDVSNKTIRHECPGHKDSVLFAKFSPDSKYVATADINELIQVFSVDDGHLVWSYEDSEYKCMTWLNKSNNLLAGTIDGTCYMWSIPDGSMSVYSAQDCGSVESVAVSHNDEKVCVGYDNGSIKIWAVCNPDSPLGSVSGPSASKKAISDVKISPDNALIITGSLDGDIKLIKMSDFKVLFTIHVCDINNHSHGDYSVESVGFCQNPGYVAAATNCGVINIYDISSKTKRCSVTVNCSVVKIICDDTEPILYAALAGGMLQAYDVRSGNLLKTWAGHRRGLLDVAISSDRSLLLTSSEDASIKMFERGILL